MNDIMKMIRFDLISVSRLTVPYVAIFAAVCIIAANSFESNLLSAGITTK